MKFKKSAAALGATALIALAGPAMAVPPYQIDVGSSTSGDHGFDAETLTGGIAFSVNGPSGPVDMDCVSSEAQGTVHAGASTSGLDIATIANTDWFDCTGPLGLEMTVVHNGAWELNATGTATNAATDTVAGNISEVDAYVYATNAEADCNFSVTGHADGEFQETGQLLAVDESGYTGNLAVSGISTGVNDCFGLIANGDEADFVGTYDVNSFDGSINIKP